MDLKQFQRMADSTYDNTKKAMEYWSTCWGLGFWKNLWAYKEYKLGNLMYRSGSVICRHHRYAVKKYYRDDKEITKKEFMDTISKMEYKPKTKLTEPFIPTFRSKRRTSIDGRQLSMLF